METKRRTTDEVVESLGSLTGIEMASSMRPTKGTRMRLGGVGAMMTETQTMGAEGTAGMTDPQDGGCKEVELVTTRTSGKAGGLTRQEREGKLLAGGSVLQVATMNGSFATSLGAGLKGMEG